MNLNSSDVGRERDIGCGSCASLSTAPERALGTRRQGCMAEREAVRAPPEVASGGVFPRRTQALGLGPSRRAELLVRQRQRDLATGVIAEIGRVAAPGERAEEDATTRERLLEAARSVPALEPLTKALEALESGGTLGPDDARALLQANKPPDAVTIENQSWLHHVCRVGNKDSVIAVLKLLKKSGAEPCAAEADILGNSPTHLAARRGDLEIVKVLLDYGFDFLATSKFGFVPREIAEMEGHADVEGFLDDASVERYLQPRLPNGMKIKSSHKGGANTARVVVGFVANGSFGDVYKVHNTETEQFEAVKLVRKVTRCTYSMASTHMLETKFLDRLKKHVDEARTMLRLGLHPNIVSIRGISLLRNVRDESGQAIVDNLYVFMDYVEGAKTLKHCIKNLDQSDVETVVGLLLDIATGLAYLESKEITHWDLKPANVLVEYGGDPSVPVRAKLTDFGEAFTRPYASKETLAAFTHGATGETKRAAAETQHQWSWATTALAVFSSLLRWCDDWKDYNEAMAVLAIRLATSEPGTLHQCLLLCQSCMHSDPRARCSMDSVVRALSKSTREPVVSNNERDSKELFSLHTELGRILMEEVTSSTNDHTDLFGHFQAARDLALAIWGQESANYATALNNLARLLSDQGKYDEAKPLYERAIEIDEDALGPNHRGLATALNNLAGLLESQGKYDEAKPLYERAIEIGEKTLGPDHPDLCVGLINLAGLLESQCKYDEAKPLYDRAIEIGEKTLGPDHPNVATALNNLAGLLESQEKYDEAKPLYVRAIEIGEKTLGADHPDLAARLNNLAGLLESQEKYDEAKPLYVRAIEIGEKTLGADHPDLAARLNNLAVVMSKIGRRAEALEHIERALRIYESVLGPDHPKTQSARLWDAHIRTESPRSSSS